MGSTAFDLRVVCYINGILFHPTGVSVSANHGDFHYFSVEIPAVPQWDVLPPRSHCVVFYSDPVTKTWRMMCEGEYAATNKTKQSHGQRARSLQFRSLHAYWQTAKYTSLVSAMLPQNIGTDVTKLLITTQAAGQKFNCDFRKGDEAFQINDLETLIDSSTVPGKRLIGFMQQLVYKVTLQTPVEAFYQESRKLNAKYFSLDDDEINTVCDARRFQDLIHNGFNNFGLGPQTNLGAIIMAYEDLLFYQHTPILNPPFADKGTKILELMFIPHLYSTIPPACNVIFADQITLMQMGRSFLQEPTRVITQMGQEVFGHDNPFPQLYMANSVTESINFAKHILPDAEKVKSQLVATHALLSEEELLRGVNAVSVNIGLEKLVPEKKALEALKSGKQGFSQIQAYMESASRHQYEVERGRVRAVSLNCSFLPYLLCGFPVLVEDSAGPFFGVIESIGHSLPCTGAPSTSVVISFVREAYVREGIDRTSPIPRWLNAKFQPNQVNQTYKDLFGIDPNDSRSHAAMVPDSVISVNQIVSSGDQATIQQETDETKQTELATSLAVTGVDLDELCRTVFETPKYKADLTAIDDGTNSGEIAKRLRKKPYPDKAFLEFQYRDGVSLSAYLKFHSLPALGVEVDDSALVEPPPDLCPKSAHPLFGSPSGLNFVGKANLLFDTEGIVSADYKPNNTHFGIYDLAPGAGGDKAEISELRQKAARTIKEAVSKRLSPN